MAIDRKKIQQDFYADPNVPVSVKENLAKAINSGQVNKDNVVNIVSKLYEPYKGKKIGTTTETKTSVVDNPIEEAKKKAAEREKILFGTTTPEQDTGFLGGIAKSITSLPQNISNVVQERGQALSSNIAKTVEGTKSDLSKLGGLVTSQGSVLDKLGKAKQIVTQGAGRNLAQGIGAAGNLVGAVTDVGMEGVKTLASPLTLGVKTIDAKLGKLPSSLAKTAGSIISSNLGLPEKAQKINELAIANPNSATALKGLIDISSAIGIGKGGQLVSKGIKEGAIQTVTKKGLEGDVIKLTQKILQPAEKKSTEFNKIGNTFELTKSQKGLIENLGDLKGVKNIEDATQKMGEQAQKIINLRNEKVKAYTGDQYKIGGDNIVFSEGKTQYSQKDLLKEMLDNIVYDLKSGGGVLSKGDKDLINGFQLTRDAIDKGQKISQDSFLVLKQKAQDLFYREAQDITKEGKLKEKFQDLNKKLQIFSDAVVPKDVRLLDKQFERALATHKDFLASSKKLAASFKLLEEKGIINKSVNAIKGIFSIFSKGSIPISSIDSAKSIGQIELLNEQMGNLIKQLNKVQNPTEYQNVLSKIKSSALNKNTVGGTGIISSIEAARQSIKDNKNKNK